MTTNRLSRRTYFLGIALRQQCQKQSTVKLYRYATGATEGSRKNLMGQPTTIEGNLYDVIHETVEQTVTLVEAISIMGPKGLQPARYPKVTLHEIITNAVIHRDYSIADDIHLRVFDNRIEVESPGPFAAHVNENNVLTTRFSRNGNIVRWINKFPDPPNKPRIATDPWSFPALGDRATTAAAPNRRRLQRTTPAARGADRRVATCAP